MKNSEEEILKYQWKESIRKRDGRTQLGVGEVRS